MTAKTLLIVGGGGYGCAVAEAASLSGAFTVVGFVDDRWPGLQSAWGRPVVGRSDQLASLRPMADAAVVAVGNNARRQALCETILAAGFELASVIHPKAFISPSAKLGRGVTVMAGAVVGSEAELGDGVIANAGCVIDHHGAVGAHAHLGIGACMGGGASMGMRSWMQEGCCLGPGESIPADVTIARHSAARG
jgi:sugar O-acyltransferase (sialic acid O-acetyltransferase NeuD family)